MGATISRANEVIGEEVRQSYEDILRSTEDTNRGIQTCTEKAVTDYQLSVCVCECHCVGLSVCLFVIVSVMSSPCARLFVCFCLENDTFSGRKTDNSYFLPQVLWSDSLLGSKLFFNLVVKKNFLS